MRVGQGFDVHRLVAGRRLVIGGVEIAYDKGLLGHSDADVLLHAICDALALVGALQRVRERHGEQPSHGIVAQLVQELLHELRLDAGARGVVHEHPVVLRDAAGEHLQRVQHGLRAVRAARGERLDARGERAPVVVRPVAVARRQHHEDALDARYLRERLEAVEDHGLAGKRDVLLGHRVADARPLPRGRDDGEDSGHGGALSPISAASPRDPLKYGA